MSFIGTEINGYKFLEFIDSGGFGSVFKASKNGIDYAVKIFREDYVLKEFREKGAENRVKREIEIMKSVDHPFLIRYVDDFTATTLGVTSYFLVMEYANGKTLRKLINESVLTEERSKELIEQILIGLNELHNIRGDEEDRGIIHRDLKPENIMVDRNAIKILDYGISKVIDYTSITTTGNVMGSPVYMSPEQITDSKHIDKRSDLYTIGVMFYEMLTGKFPYEFHSLPELYDKIKSAHPIPPRRWQPLISNDVENIILKLLEKSPYKRYAKASLVIEAITKKEPAKSVVTSDLSPKFFIRLWNEKTVLQEFIKRYKATMHVEFPANYQRQQKNLLSLISTPQFVKIIDPATMRLAYPAQQDVRGLQELPYAPAKFEVITPDYLKAHSKQQEYVKMVLDEQVKLGADILVSPYHYIHNTNVPATQKRNPVAEWFDLDIKLLKESIDYKNSSSTLKTKRLFAGICLNGDSLLDNHHRNDLLNMFSAFECDGYFIYVDCIDNSTNPSILFHYINTLRELQKSTSRAVIAGRINGLGLGLLCAGISGFSSGAARFESFYEDLYKEETDAFNMYERYYFPQLLGTIAISKKSPLKLQAIIDKVGACDCFYCKGKSIVQTIETPNNKLHFLEKIHEEVAAITMTPIDERMNYFIGRVDQAIANYQKLPEVFPKRAEYQHLLNWREVFSELNKR